MSFKEFSGGKPASREEKVEVIVGFLAMLELVKEGIVEVKQDSTSVILKWRLLPFILLNIVRIDFLCGSLDLFQCRNSKIHFLVYLYHLGQPKMN